MSDLATALVVWPGAVLMLTAAVSVFRTGSMARAGLLLLAALGLEGLLFLALASEFLGVLMLLMMAGEMVIMVFFMIMFMADPGGLMGMDMTHAKRTSAAVAGAAGIALALLALLGDWPSRALPWGAPDVQAIGLEVMGRSIVSFLFAALTILVAIVGSLMLATHVGRPVPEEEQP